MWKLLAKCLILVTKELKAFQDMVADVSLPLRSTLLLLFAFLMPAPFTFTVLCFLKMKVLRSHSFRMVALLAIARFFKLQNCYIQTPLYLLKPKYIYKIVVFLQSSTNTLYPKQARLVFLPHSSCCRTIVVFLFPIEFAS